MKSTQADTLRAELINLRHCQNAPGYDYDTDVECRFRAVIKALAALARRKQAARLYRETMFDLNGHHGKA